MTTTNSGSGFAASAAQWSVPSRGTDDGFNHVTDLTWTTMDLDGDGRPDLVSAGPTSHFVFGNDNAAYWKLFRGIP